MGKIVLLCWVALLTLAAAGCSNFMGRISGETARQEALKAEQLQLQKRVMRFADEFVEHMGLAVTRFQAAVGTPEARLIGQDWKLAQATAAFQIASGDNGINNALDMIVLLSLSHMVVADSWVRRFGE